MHGRLGGTQSRSVPFGEETPPCPGRKLNWDSAYSLLRILQVEQRCGGCHFRLHRCYTCLPSRFVVVVFRSAVCHVHAKFKSRQPVVWCMLQHCHPFWKDLPRTRTTGQRLRTEQFGLSIAITCFRTRARSPGTHPLTDATCVYKFFVSFSEPHPHAKRSLNSNLTTRTAELGRSQRLCCVLVARVEITLEACVQKQLSDLPVIPLYVNGICLLPSYR